MSGLTTEQLAVSTRTPRFILEPLLADEASRGHVEQVGGRWRPTPDFVRRYGRAFAYVLPPTYTGTKTKEIT
jgi:hypothetical protein